MKKFRFFIILFVIPTVIFSQTKKTFNDSNFSKGDIIRVPNLEVELLNREKDVINDSLEVLIDFLKRHSDMKLELACHTDSRGNLAGNLQASQYRAEGIRNYLIKRKNINPEMIKAKGYGETKLLISDQTISNAKTKEEKEKLNLINRRIELIVL